MHSPTLAVLVVFMAHWMWALPGPNPTCRSVKSQTPPASVSSSVYGEANGTYITGLL